MIINISGTGGSGKSTLVRRVMDCYDTVKPIFIEGRKRPFSYVCLRENGNNLWVPGHYETACGGGDTLSTFPNYLDSLYGFIRSAHNEKQDVMYEGLLVESDVRRCAELKRDGFPVLVLSLSTDLETCLSSTVQRRLAKGNTKPLNPKNTKGRWRQVRFRIDRLKGHGIEAIFLSRDEMFEECKKRLNLPMECFPTIRSDAPTGRLGPTL